MFYLKKKLCNVCSSRLILREKDNFTTHGECELCGNIEPLPNEPYKEYRAKHAVYIINKKDIVHCDTCSCRPCMCNSGIIQEREK